QISFGGVKNGLRLHVWRRLRGLSPQVASSAPSLLGSSSAGLPLAFMRPRPPPPRPRADSRRGPERIPAAAPGGFPPRPRADSRRGPWRIPAAAPGGFAPVARADSRRWEEQRPRLPWVRPNSPLAPVGGILTTRRRKPVAGCNISVPVSTLDRLESHPREEKRLSVSWAGTNSGLGLTGGNSRS